MNEAIPLTSAAFPWLSLLILLLPLGAVIAAFLAPREARWAALATSVGVLLISLIIVAGFNPQLAGFQFVERSPWIPSLDIQYLLGVDGISVLFLPFSALLFIGVILASWNAIQNLPRLFFPLILLLEMAMMGIFSALDTILFFLFWELSVLPIYFLISLWGIGPNRRYAGVKYTLFMLTGGVPLLLGFVVLALQNPGGITFDYTRLLHIAHTHNYQTAIFILLTFAFAVKLPLFPLHSWLPVVAQEAPTQVVAILVGLKVGVYGMIRFAFPLAPSAFQDFQYILIGLGMLGVLYGALAALGQTNLRRMLAFSSLSHVAMVFLGVVSMTQQGLQGAIFQLLNFTVIASGLFLIVGFIYQRVGSSEIPSLGGIAKSMPLLTTFFFILGAANLGIPGTSGFPAEFLMTIGVLENYLGAGLLALFSIILAAAYFLSAYRQAFLGKTRHATIGESPDLKPRELFIMLLFTSIVLIFGFYPQGILDLIATSSIDWLERMTLMME